MLLLIALVHNIREVEIELPKVLEANVLGTEECSEAEVIRRS